MKQLLPSENCDHGSTYLVRVTTNDAEKAPDYC